MEKLKLLIAPLVALSFFSGCSNDGFKQITFDEFWNYLDKYKIYEKNEGALKVKVSCKFNSSEIYDPKAEELGHDYYSDFINKVLLYEEFSNKFTIDYNNPIVEDEFTYDDPFQGVKAWGEVLEEAVYEDKLDLFKNDYYFNGTNNVLAIRTTKSLVYDLTNENLHIASGSVHTSMYFDLNRKCITHIEATIDKIKFDVYSGGGKVEKIYTSPNPFSGHILLDWFDFVPIKKL